MAQRTAGAALALALAWAALASAFGACRSSGAPRTRSDTLLERLEPSARARMAEAREAWARGELQLAHESLQSLLRLAPAEFEPALELQELELALLAEGEAVAGLPALSADKRTPADVRAHLAGAYRARAGLYIGASEGALPASAPESRALDSTSAESSAAASAPQSAPAAELAPASEFGLAGEAEPAPGSAAAAARARAFVLYARLAQPGDFAWALLERARALAPNDAWVAYARAHTLHVRLQRTEDARRELARALELDPGLTRAWRLRGALLAREGRLPEAAQWLAAWIERAEREQAPAPSELDAARIDLASAHVLDGEPKRALETLAQAAPAARADEQRMWLVRAAAHEALGRPEQALAAARAAAAVDPSSSIALVQQALLLETWLRDEPAATAAWKQVLALGQGGASAPAASDENGGSGLQQMLLRVQARMHLVGLERRARERAEAANRATARAPGTPEGVP